jgi:hypothetical protein
MKKRSFFSPQFWKFKRMLPALASNECLMPENTVGECVKEWSLGKKGSKTPWRDWNVLLKQPVLVRTDHS